MKIMQMHRLAGLRIAEQDSDETLYRNPLDLVAQDAEITLDWPEARLLRIFPLPDGRIAVVRETVHGLSQEAAAPSIQALYKALADKAELLIQKEAARQALEASADTSSSDTA